MIIEIPNAVGDAELKDIKEAVKPYIDSALPSTYNRDGKTVGISRIPELEHIDNYLHQLFARVQAEVIVHRYKPPFSSADSGYEYHLYRPGEICHYHADGEFSKSFVDPQPKDMFLRYASVTLHLNTVKEGGELVFPAQNKKVKTEAGKIVVFPPYGMFGHYTTPSEEPREVIVTWFVYEGIKTVRT